MRKSKLFELCLHRCFAAIWVFALFSCSRKTISYVCVPCNLACDTITQAKSGSCASCNMPLVKKSSLYKNSEKIEISKGSGVFVIDGGFQKKEKTIKVYYHKPQHFNNQSKVLIVVPGDGRNGDSYRDAWVQTSEKYGVLILSPMYAEQEYPFEDYHMGGVLEKMNIENSIERIAGTNIIQLEESKLSITPKNKPQEWLFKDFDRIFDIAVKSTKTNQVVYDIFGHSAGGQILHRFALFYPRSKADRILAANAGFYTMPDFSLSLPFGIKNTSVTADELSTSFKKKLVLFVGELDNENETGGNLLRSVTADKQGVHRLARSKYFYEKAKNLAEEYKFDFRWKLEIVSGVGHNQRKMAMSAAQFLYGD